HHARALLEPEPARLATGAVAALRDGGALFLVIGIDGLQDVDGRDFSAPDRGQHVLDILLRQARQRRLQPILGEIAAGALEGALDDLAAEAGILLADRRAGGTPDRGARLAG